MMSELTTVQISKKAFSRLQQIATFFRRSKTAQVEWMIDREFEDLPEEFIGPSDSKAQTNKTEKKEE